MTEQLFSYHYSGAEKFRVVMKNLVIVDQKDYEQMISILKKMYYVRWNEVYEYGYGKFEGNQDEAKKFADKNDHVIEIKNTLNNLGLNV